jgi:two-component system, NarL family, response regulator DesR
MIRILIAEDQGMVRGALAALLAFEPDLEVVAEVGAGDEVLAAARQADPDVALLDIEMPGMDGIEAAAALRDELPDTVPLILTTLRPPRPPAQGNGGRSEGLPGQGPARRATRQRDPARRRGRAGGRPGASRHGARRPESPLTPREREVLEASADGSPVADVSARLYLSEGTVRNYLSAAIGKTGARNRAEALRVARERAWV